MLRHIGFAVAGSLALAGLSVAPAFASSGPAPYTNGELVRFQGQSAVYQVQNSGMVWIPNAAMFNAMGLHWSAIQVLPDGIPHPPIQFIDYLRLATNTRYPYQLNDNGTVSPILPGSTPFTQNQFDNPNLPGPFYPVSTLPGPLVPLNAPISQYALPPSGSLVRHAGQSAIYLRTTRGDFSWIPSAALFNAAGFQWSQVVTVPDNILLNAGSPKTLIHVAGSPKVYDILNGTLHWIPSWADFTSWGFSANAIQSVNYLPYPIGAPLTTQPS